MYAIYGNIYHKYTPNVSIYTIHDGSIWILWEIVVCPIISTLYFGMVSFLGFTKPGHFFRFAGNPWQLNGSTKVPMVHGPPHDLYSNP